MKDIIIHCRKLDEWDEDTQAKIIEKHRLIEVEWDGWSDFVIEDWQDKLNKMGFFEPKIAYTGFWSQGDGASFTCDNIFVQDYIKYFKLKQFYPILRRLREGNLEIFAYIHRYNNHYYHEKSTSVNFNWSYLGLGKYKTKMEEQLEALEEHMDKTVIELGKEIYKDLENEYEDRVSDDTVREVLIANEYELDEEGKIWE